MKRFLLVVSVWMALMLSNTVVAQNPVKRTTEKMKVGSKEFYMHRVKSGETLADIAWVYNISIKEITDLNPSAHDPLGVGLVLGIPVREERQQPKVEEPVVVEEPQPAPKPVVVDEPKPTPEPVVVEEPQPAPKPVVVDEPKPTPQPVVVEEPKPTPKPEVVNEPQAEKPFVPTPVELSDEIVTIGGKQYFMHHVLRGQTLYGISQAYGISVEEIQRLNPDEVRDGLKAGTVIGIPMRLPDSVDEPKVEMPESVDMPKPVEPESVDMPKVVEPESVDMPKVVEPVAAKPVESEAKPMEAKEESASIVIPVGGDYVVQPGEDLYDIAKRFGIDLADFKAINPGLTNEPAAGMLIHVPDIANEDDYMIHKVEFSERTSSLLKRWKVTDEEFRAINVSVGSRVFTGQIVLIPIERADRVEAADANTIVETPAIEEEEAPITIDDNPPVVIVEEPQAIPECEGSTANASKRYKVALLIPLYLNEVDNMNISRENIMKVQKSRPLSFLQFYQGFVMAADSLAKHHGLKVDLTVIDVTDKVNTAHTAVSQMENKDFDLIVGPFFSKSFAVVEEYALSKGILVVNPLSSRSDIIKDYPNVVKIQPNANGQLPQLAKLVRDLYSDSNVFIVSQEKAADTAMLSVMEQLLNLSINEEVTVSNEAFLRYAQREATRLEMGKRLPSTLNVEGQVYATNDMKEGAVDNVVFHNQVRRYSNTSADMKEMLSHFSGVRNNLVVAYGSDNVFATQMLNTLNKDAEPYPITLVALPDWSKHEKLLVDNLLKMNAIYLSEGFVDYGDKAVKRFVLSFRKKYKWEPQEYAFEGFDVAWYFLNALMRYGADMKECLPYYDLPLMQSHFRFAVPMGNDGLENQFWRIYQHDKENIELRVIE